MLRTLIAFLTIFSCAVLSVSAQEFGISKSINANNGYFDHLDVSASLGSTGIGIDVATPIGPYFKVRAGATYMPRFEMSSHFRVQVGDSLERKYDSHGNRLETKFDKLSGMLKSMVGYEVDDEVEMLIQPTYYNFHLLFDIHPFRDKRWHFTTGLYVGSKELGRAVNSTADMTSLMAVNMYNMMYDRVMTEGALFDFGSNIPPLDLAPEIQEPLQEKFQRYGRMAFPVGYYLNDGPMVSQRVPGEYDDEGNDLYVTVPAYRKGDPYMMVPDTKDGMVHVTAKAKSIFRPYVGFGYGGAISKDGLTELTVDAGVFFWGGKPHAYTHDGVDLVYDVEGIKGKVGRYVKAVKLFPVFPVLELRITRRIF